MEGVQTPHRKDPLPKPRPSCCEAALLTTAPPCIDQADMENEWKNNSMTTLQITWDLIAFRFSPHRKKISLTLIKKTSIHQYIKIINNVLRTKRPPIYFCILSNKWNPTLSSFCVVLTKSPPSTYGGRPSTLNETA